MFGTGGKVEETVEAGRAKYPTRQWDITVVPSGIEIKNSKTRVELTDKKQRKEEESR